MTSKDYINDADKHYSEEGYTEDLTFANLVIPQDCDYEDFGEETEEIEVGKAVDFTKSDPAGACWKGYERVPNTKEGEPGSCRKIGSSESDKKSQSHDAGGMEKYVFESKDEAMKMAKKIGLKNVHSHKSGDGKTLWMPGKNMKEFQSWYEKHSSKAAEYQGKKVTLNKPFLTPDGPKKRSVYVKNDKGNVVKVNFGDPNMKIKKNDPERRRSFRARHKCETPGPKWKARYWSCKMW